MSQEYHNKRLKPFPRFLEEDAPFKRSHAIKLVKTGVIKTVRIGKRDYVDMIAWRKQEAGVDGGAA